MTFAVARNELLFALLEGPDALALSGAAQVYRRHQHNAKIKPYVQNDLEGQGDDGDSLKSSIYSSMVH